MIEKSKKQGIEQKFLIANNVRDCEDISTNLMHFHEDNEDYFFNPNEKIWYMKDSLKRKKCSYKEYQGPIPFEFSKDKLKDLKIPYSQTYYLGRDGTWVNGSFFQLPSQYNQRMDLLFYDKLSAAYNNSSKILRSNFSIGTLFELITSSRDDSLEKKYKINGN